MSTPPRPDYERRNRSIRFFDSEWAEVKKAAARMAKAMVGEGLGIASWWDNGPAKPATWVFGVALDWARYVNKLPASRTAQKPSQEIEVLHKRIAQLEAQLAGKAATLAEAVPSTRKPKAAGGRR